MAWECFYLIVYFSTQWTYTEGTCTAGAKLIPLTPNPIYAEPSTLVSVKLEIRQTCQHQFKRVLVDNITALVTSRRDLNLNGTIFCRLVVQTNGACVPDKDCSCSVEGKEMKNTYTVSRRIQMFEDEWIIKAYMLQLSDVLQLNVPIITLPGITSIAGDYTSSAELSLPKTTGSWAANDSTQYSIRLIFYAVSASLIAVFAAAVLGMCRTLYRRRLWQVSGREGREKRECANSRDPHTGVVPLDFRQRQPSRMVHKPEVVHKPKVDNKAEDPDSHVYQEIDLMDASSLYQEIDQMAAPGHAYQEFPRRERKPAAGRGLGSWLPKLKRAKAFRGHKTTRAGGEKGCNMPDPRSIP